MAGIGVAALQKKQSGKSSLRDIVTKTKGSLGTKLPKIKDTLDWEGTTPKRKVEETKKKKKKTEDLKISGNSKKTKTKSKKGTSYSGPGDANL